MGTSTVILCASTSSRIRGRVVLAAAVISGAQCSWACKPLAVTHQWRIRIKISLKSPQEDLFWLYHILVSLVVPRDNDESVLGFWRVVIVPHDEKLKPWHLDPKLSSLVVNGDEECPMGSSRMV